MKQKTNLNTSPYYDDFDQSKNFYKVLFKPGFPVQARELTGSQSISQDQLSKLSTYVFKDGAKVIPGDPSFQDNVRSIKLNSTNFGVDVSLYTNNLVGKVIVGQSSGIRGNVKFTTTVTDSENNSQIILYIDQTSSGNNLNSFDTFQDGESITCEENVIYGNTTINAGTPVASLISSNSTGYGSLAHIEKGVYYIRGYFVNVNQQTIILDVFKNKPSYRVGLKVDEIIVNAKEDSSLYDNATGFTNFAAPGADRLQINLTLTKKLLTDKNDTDFVLLLEIEEGKVKKVGEGVNDNLNLLGDVLAKRTFEESGNYSVRPFIPSIHNSLNDKLGNNGLYFSNQLTDQDNIPSDDLMCVKISPGLSYVRGNRVLKSTTSIIDVDKPRDVGIQTNSAVDFEMGNILRVNNVQGVPKQGTVVSLFDNFNSTGNLIGSARVYSFNLENPVYSGATTNWDLRLFDIQTFSTITLNTPIGISTIPEGSFIRGKNSNASGFVRPHYANAVGIVTLSETSGTFMAGEELTVNGIDLERSVGIITSNNIQQIKSVSQPTSSNFPNISGSGFKADSFLERFRVPGGIGAVDISARSGAGGGISTVTAGGESFTGLRKGSIIRYISAGVNTERFNKVQSIASDGLSMVIEPLTTVFGVFEGSLPTTNTTPTIFAAAPNIRGTGNLFKSLNNSNVESIDLSSSQLTVTKQITGKTISSGTLTVNSSSDTDLTNSSFVSFDQERYSVHNDNGTIQSLNRDNFSTNGTTFTLTGLDNDTVVLNSTLSKNEIKSKIKTYNKSQLYYVRLSNDKGSGSSVGNSIQDGLIFDKRYGLRVQDEEISLNYPDTVKVLSVLESLDENDPILDTLSFSDTVDVDNNAIIGEDIISDDKSIVARVISKPASNQLSVVYLTLDKFTSTDNVTFSESNIQTKINSIINVGKYKDLTNSYELDKGQRNEYYDYSRIIRNKNVSSPSRRLLIIFDYYSAANNDEGDVFTVLSYDNDRFNFDIPTIGPSNVRATDTIDFRPRVPIYDVSTGTISPFTFGSRDFSTIKQFITPNESFTLNYNFYLPRIDNLYLSKNGNFVYEKGVSSVNPKPPVRNDELMKLATITLPPYLYSPENASLLITENKRFTMKDIGTIEDRVSNLEEVTSLSLLENNVQTLQILDSEGRNRFKSGFFVDPFRNYNLMNSTLSSVEVDLFSNVIFPIRSRNTLDLVPKLENPLSQADFDSRQNNQLFDSNVRRTGDLITLDYEEVEWFGQEYATSSLNINPFLIPSYTGQIRLTPASDLWTRTIENDLGVIRQDGVNTTQNLNLNTVINGELGGDITQVTTNVERLRLTPGQARLRDIAQGRTVTIEDGGTSSIRGQLSLNGSASDSVTVRNVDTVIDNRLTSSIAQFMRSRNVQFETSSFPSYTQFFTFLDKEIVDFIPKLVEVSPTKNGSGSGTSNSSFIIGETVEVYDNTNQPPVMQFRVCKPDHKTGAFNNPSESYQFNPYTYQNNNADRVPQNYSLTTPIVNIDTLSLSNESQSNYFGYLETGYKLVGTESNAEAYVKNKRLITDNRGDLIGTFFVRDPNTIPPPDRRFNTGEKTFLLTTSSTNATFIPGVDPNIFAAQIPFTSEGTKLEFEKETIQTVNSSTFNINADFEANIETNITVTQQIENVVEAEYFDPLAQTFVIGSRNPQTENALNTSNDQNGAYITSVEVFFRTIDPNTDVTLQMRTTDEGTRPSKSILASKTLASTQFINGVSNQLIQTSEDASVGTKFTFDEPLYLSPNETYAIVLLAPDSDKYTVFTGVSGQTALNPQSIPGAAGGESIQYSQQYTLGAIFKSQNGALWSEDNEQDLTFKLYKAKFVSSGSLLFHNSELGEGNNYIPKLIPNSIETFPKTGSIRITSIAPPALGTLAGILTTGRKICGINSTSTAVITGVGASVLSGSISDGGSNYVVDGSVDTFAITGGGSGLTLSITGVDSDTGAINAISAPIFEGVGYKVGDIVGVVTSSVGTSGGQGRGAQITIASIVGINKLFLTNVKGDNNSFAGNVGTAVSFFDDSNNIVSLGGTFILTNDLNTTGVNAGNLFKVNNLDHGMYSNTNKLDLKNISSDVVPTELSATLLNNESSSISVASTSVFTNFEGAPVSGINTGYVKIDNEIIGYDGVGGGVLNIASGANGRGVDNTNTLSHDVNTLVSKYELNGVSIRRLSKNNLNVNSNQIELDSHFVEFDRSTNGKNRSSDSMNFPQLSFNSKQSTGGNFVRSSENISFNSIKPNIIVSTPVGVDGARTDINASIRTISGTSVGGNEPSFVDLGYEPVSLNNLNPLNSVRMVASKVNENQYLNSLSENKSFTLLMNLSSNNPNLSPAISMRTLPNVELYSSRINRPIDLDSYDVNSEVNSILNDPHAAAYVSNSIKLSKPATSLKVILTANRPASADFRVLYSLNRINSEETAQSFELFPGYKNLTNVDPDDGFGDLVVDSTKNDGRADSFVPSNTSNQFSEYQFTADNLDEFNGYTIKIVMSSSDQSAVPRIKELRTIAVR